MARIDLLALAALTCVACGRIGFDPAADAPDIDAPSPGFCASLPQPVTFCSDFDDADGTATWIGGSEQTFGTYMIDRADSTSAPASVVVSTPTKVAGEIGRVFLSHDLPMATTSVTASVDMKIDVSGQGDPVLARIAIDEGPQTRELEYVYNASGSYFEDIVTLNGQSPMYAYINLAAPSTNTWHRISFTWILGTSPRLTSTLDGVTLIDMPLIGTRLTGPMLFDIGVRYHSGASTPWQVRFDNAVVEVD